MSESTLNPFGALLSIDLDALCDNWRNLRGRLAGADCAQEARFDHLPGAFHASAQRPFQLPLK